MIVYQIFLGFLALAGIGISLRGVIMMSNSHKYPTKLDKTGTPSIWFPGVGQMWGGVLLFIIAASIL